MKMKDTPLLNASEVFEKFHAVQKRKRTYLN